ncbi:diguanylate cyclase (GGDEF) domain-containing protein [Peptoclostridium litorale DSM 5388]|uniref:Putative diguanylate cyclase n=1 Tax=Peptoclostridium litorale DSM 5388 TaxID=1121324 RepID=A0A069RCR4_PEPLI|nr:diguanylate cyclase [Peptoclostridium litorale]KDR94553.1 putative diguanylate cyclase [Peptoclostridium litorale DSM 5388]SIO31312.1 diguanylate cyclase (GGDEF) domain-containing protein [Peptoclostridium litorale DSM 5388]
MKLSDKISVIFFMEMLSLTIIIFIFSNTIFLSGFENVEIMNVKKDIARLSDELEYEINLLDSINHDYAVWDDTYEFSEHGNEDYIDSNFKYETISKQFIVDFVLITDEKIRPVFQSEYDTEDASEMPVENDIKELIDYEKLAGEVIQSGRSLKGIVKTSEGFAMVSIRPVLKSSGEGPAAGVIIMGRKLDEGEISRFAKITYLDLDVYENKQFKAIQGIENLNGVLVKMDGEIIKSYLPVETIKKDTTMVLEISSVADIYSLGAHLLKKYIYIVISMALVFAYTSNRIFEKAFTSRLMNIQRFMENMGKGKSKKNRVAVGGKDEISSLGISINLMLDRLEESHDKAVQEEQRYRLLFEHMSESFTYSKAVYSDEAKTEIVDFEIVEANSQFYNMVGAQGFEPEEKRFSQIEKNYGYPITAVTKVFKEFWSEYAGNTREIQVNMDERWYSLIIYALQAEHFGMIFWDITAIKERESDIIEMAKLDHLTNLPNRKYLAEYIELLSKEALENEKMFAVMFLDVDDFKQINDTYGHKYGDYVLKTIADIISESVRGDDFVARIGGDEFVVVMSRVRSEKDPLGLSERIQSRIHEYFSENEISKMGISIGISIFPRNGRSIEQLIENADKAMYNAKKSGKGKSELYVE